MGIEQSIKITLNCYSFKIGLVAPDTIWSLFDFYSSFLSTVDTYPSLYFFNWFLMQALNILSAIAPLYAVYDSKPNSFYIIICNVSSWKWLSSTIKMFAWGFILIILS